MSSVLQEAIFYSWLNPIYLDIEVQADIRTKFEAESEIELTDFLQVCILALKNLGLTEIF